MDDNTKQQHVQQIAEALHKAVAQPAQGQPGQPAQQHAQGFAGLSGNPFFAAFASQLIDIIAQIAHDEVTKRLSGTQAQTTPAAPKR